MENKKMEKEDRGTEKGKKIKSILLVAAGIKVIPRYPSKDKESKNTGGGEKGWNKSPLPRKRLSRLSIPRHVYKLLLHQNIINHP
jgi:hypothetical protein